MGLLGWGWLDLGLGRVLQECRNEGTPLGQRGIAAVAGGHCVGLPLKCNHRAEQSRAEPAPEAAIKRGVEKQSRYRQPPPTPAGTCIGQDEQVSRRGAAGRATATATASTAKFASRAGLGRGRSRNRAEQVRGLGRGRVAGCKRVIAKQLPSCKD